MNLRRARLLQLLGFLVALLGLTGYWLTHDTVERTPLTQETREILGITDDVEDDEIITFVIAGRDIAYTQLAGPVVRNENGVVIGRKYEAKSNAYGSNTDTIIFAQIVGNKVSLIPIPRDVWLPNWETKINSMYYYQQAEGVKRGVSEVLGIPVDYYAIINIDIFKHVVDALDGVEVNVTERMKYQDIAGSLSIDLQPGVQILDGEEAAGFVRFRGVGGDYNRIDRVKTLSYAVLDRLKELNVRAAGKLPELIKTVYDDTETNASLALVSSLMGKINSIEIANSITLPTSDVRVTLPSGESVAALEYDPAEVETVLARAFGGTAREFTEAPDTRLLITNSSGERGLAEAIKARLVTLGVPEDSLLVRDGELDVTPTRIYATYDSFESADYYSSLLGISRQQTNTLAPYDGEEPELELVLGRNAADSYLGQTLSASATNPNATTER